MQIGQLFVINNNNNTLLILSKLSMTPWYSKLMGILNSRAMNRFNGTNKASLFISAVFILMTSLICNGQDYSKGDSSKISYDIDIGFGSYYQFSSFGSTNLNNAVFAQNIGRRIKEPNVRNTWGLNEDQLTDNPFFHGSYLMKIGGKFNYGQDFEVVGSIIGEQRGFSDGVFSDQTRNLYTYLNAIYSKSYGKFSYFIQAGDFWDFKLYEGLTFYNLETQSWIFKLQYGNFYIKHSGIGDLIKGIGLGIDDLYDYSFGVESVHIDVDKLYPLDIRLGRSINRGSIGQGFNNLSLRLSGPKNKSLYLQFSNGFNGQDSAFLLGGEFEFKPTPRIEFNVNTEFRTYNSLFNKGYANTVYYRNPDEPATYTNATNDVFIPLDFFERTFSQWAIYSEYQDENIASVATVNNANYNLFRSSFFLVDLDLNYLISESENFLYPFYNIGYAVRPVGELEISLTLTNRVMNFDKNYPTLYRSDNPYFLLRMYKPLSFIAKNNSKYQTLIKKLRAGIVQ